MADSVPQIFDRKRLVRNRARAAGHRVHVAHALSQSPMSVPHWFAPPKGVQTYLGRLGLARLAPHATPGAAG